MSYTLKNYPAGEFTANKVPISAEKAYKILETLKDVNGKSMGDFYFDMLIGLGYTKTLGGVRVGDIYLLFSPKR